MLLGSKIHTSGNTTRWEIDYEDWLANTAVIDNATVTSPSPTCTIVPSPAVLGDVVVFFTTGGTVGETLIVSITMKDSFQNVKNDTIAFTVVAP